MFELNVARKYLTPRWRQLSVSIISLISIMVIALVVWLIVVFFSVTNGLEKSWVGKLIALTAPIRVIPTDDYYQSYYYQADSISSDSNYSLKTIREKLQAAKTDPYDPEIDEEPPSAWSKPDLNPEGNLKDPVKEAFGIISRFPGIKASDFEMTMANLRLHLLRPEGQANLGYATYLGSFDPENHMLRKAMLPFTSRDYRHIFEMTELSGDNVQEDNAGMKLTAPPDLLRSRLKAFFSGVKVLSLQASESGWAWPLKLWPEEGSFQAVGCFKNGRLAKIVVPPTGGVDGLLKSAQVEGYEAKKLKLAFRENKPYVSADGADEEALSRKTPLILPYPLEIGASVRMQSIETALSPMDVVFDLSFNVQGKVFKGSDAIGSLKIGKTQALGPFSELPERVPPWFYAVRETGAEARYYLPADPFLGEGVLLPRPFRDAGVLAGDRGYLSYVTPTTSSLQEQRLPIFVAGFYDPGIIPIGGKYVLVNQDVTSLIRSSHNREDTALSNGINLRFDNLEEADHLKGKLQEAFREAGISSYWKIETYKEFDFTKDLIQQLRSEKNLFSLIATIIIVVACSNIISMLIILVNDKKTEIGILRSMGASSLSIALIFGTCGIVMGVLGSLLGIGAAILTLKNLQQLINFLSRMQGHEMFNPMFFGETLPTELSWEALSFVVIATALISLIAGLVPALKACMMRPSAILRSE